MAQRRDNPYLGELMYMNYWGGLRWETKGSTKDENGTLIHSYRFLLHFPGNNHISKNLVRGLNSTKKRYISMVLADLYDYATENVHKCHAMNPQDFFALARDSHDWSSYIGEVQFWQFTYKLFQARALFLDKHETRKDAPRRNHALVTSLDRFRDAFYAYYNRPIQEETRQRYFKFASADCEGDGTDRLVTTPVKSMEDDPNAAKYQPKEGESYDEREVIAFYFDLGPNQPRFGHTDATQEMEGALDQNN
ncbi:hypothetical protein F5Y19DRAFT_473513 [Xylariaceae sp. FL1651]|nr:hypothetical protein F5Y19DRAFT_473513 [Xylariaceae sp. FL1651]